MQTFRLSLRASFRVYVFIAVLLMMGLMTRYTPESAAKKPPSHVAEFILGAILVLITAATLLRWWFERVVAEDEGFASYNFLNRRGRTVRYEDLTAYRPTKTGRWIPFAGDQRVKIAEIELPEFHRVLVAKAPKALKARRLKGGLTPPSTEYRSMLMFDAYDLFTSILSAGIVCLPFCLLIPRLAFTYLCILVLPELYHLVNLGGRLTVDADGLRAHWPWQKREIAWPEATAIFCERRGRDRSFVVTSNDTSIVIPRHIALDLEVMQKVLHSLPIGTLCVGFDDSIKRGWRRGKRRRIPAGAAPILDPAFGAGF